jgi:hypothetical protein
VGICGRARVLSEIQAVACAGAQAGFLIQRGISSCGCLSRRLIHVVVMMAWATALWRLLLLDVKSYCDDRSWPVKVVERVSSSSFQRGISSCGCLLRCLIHVVVTVA